MFAVPIDQPPYQIVDGTALIDIRLDNLHRLYNTLDPSPFSTRDLDAGAEQYMVDAVEDLYRQHPIRLRLTVLEKEHEALDHVEAAVHHFFDYRRWAVERSLKVLFREGRLALLIGVVFLAVCLTLRQIILGLELGIAGTIVSEGLFISSWVVMWRPIEIFLFDWWPIAKRRRIFAALAEIPIEVRTAGGNHVAD